LTVAEFCPVALNVSVAVPLVLSASWASATVTVCAVFQLAVVNVSDAGDAVMSVSPVRLTATVTLADGCWLSLTDTGVLLPSGTVTVDGVAWMLGPATGSTNTGTAVDVVDAPFES